MMNKVIILLPLLAFFLVGCSSTPEVKQIAITSTAIEKLPLSITNPQPLELQNVEWIIAVSYTHLTLPTNREV